MHRRERVAKHRLTFESLEARRLLATFSVTSATDSGSGSLREAIGMANSNPGTDDVVFDISLEGQVVSIVSELSITESVNIDASALASLSIDASAGDATLGVRDGMGIRAFHIDDGSYSTTQTVNLRGLTITGGDVNGNGGAIYSVERLEVIDSTLTGNYASSQGGAIWSGSYGEFLIEGVEISNNEAGSIGGGIFAIASNFTEPQSNSIRDSQVTGNIGGGVRASLSYQAALEISDSLFSENTGRSGLTLSIEYGGSVTVRSSGFYNNQSFGGGGIAISGGLNSGEILIDDCIVQGNTASYSGGGISALADEALVRIRNSTITGNSTAGTGGGIIAGGSEYGGVGIYGSLIQGNLANTGGGIGAYIGGGTYIKVDTSTISNNESISDGGGIQADFGFGIVGIGGTFRMVESTVSSNFAGGAGGGIDVDFPDYNLTSDFRMTNSTVSSNQSNGNGGGIYINAAEVYSNSASIRHVTVAANTAVQAGGGIMVAGALQPLLNHALVADNAGAGGMQAQDDLVGTVEGVYSLIESNSGGSILGGNNLLGVDPALATLSSNGGPAQTVPLQPGSAAIDAGNPNAVAGTGNIPEFDQRGDGFSRVVNGRIDIGAFESGNNFVDGDFDDDGDYDCDDIDLLISEVASGATGTAVDLTGDGIQDLADRDAWLVEAGAANLGPGRAYLIGDANLDGFVDGLDFIVWNENKFSNTAAWCRADFNADGFTDGQDFIEWNNNKFQSSDALSVALSAGSENRRGAEPPLKIRLSLAVMRQRWQRGEISQNCRVHRVDATDLVFRSLDAEDTQLRLTE